MALEKDRGGDSSELTQRVPTARRKSPVEEPKAACGIRPFPARGGIVTNELIDIMLQDDDACQWRGDANPVRLRINVATGRSIARRRSDARCWASIREFRRSTHISHRPILHVEIRVRPTVTERDRVVRWHGNIREV